MMHDAASHERIQLRAYYLWNERGCPIGTPEVDWFCAEQELAQEPVDHESALLVAAKTIGAALGNVASAVDSLGRARHKRTKRSRE